MKNYDPFYFKEKQGSGAGETALCVRCRLTYINTTISGRQPDMNHLGDDKQRFPRNWRNFTLNVAARTPLPPSSYFSSWRFQCF